MMAFSSRKDVEYGAWNKEAEESSLYIHFVKILWTQSIEVPSVGVAHSNTMLERHDSVPLPSILLYGDARKYIATEDSSDERLADG